MILRFKLLLVVYFLVVIAFVGIVVWGIWTFSYHIQKHGLKSIIEQIWEGKG